LWVTGIVAATIRRSHSGSRSIRCAGASADNTGASAGSARARARASSGRVIVFILVLVTPTSVCSSCYCGRCRLNGGRTTRTLVLISVSLGTLSKATLSCTTIVAGMIAGHVDISVQTANLKRNRRSGDQSGEDEQESRQRDGELHG